MKIFLDTAHLAAIEKAKATGLINGITTNPTHLSKEGNNIRQLLLNICAVMAPDDVSIEITEQEPQKVYEQAKRIAALASNVVVKIPCYKDYVPVIKKLVDEGVLVNITLLFSTVQGLLMAKLGVKYISPFIGRLDDIDVNGLDLIRDLRHLIDTYNFSTQLLAASVRHILHVHEVALLGADIATIPVTLFDVLLEHPLTDKGMKQFENDWKKLDIKQFP
jgi:transaldolase